MSDFYQPSGIEMKGDGWGVVNYNRGNVAMFYNRSVHNPAKSAEAGAPVYDDKVFLKSFVPGEQRFNIVDRPATQQDQRTWPREWHQFQQNAEQTPEGIPVDQLYPEKPSIASTLKASGIHTIEQLVDLSATAIDSVGMGCQQWVNDAKRFLDIAKKGVTATQYRKEREKMEGEIRVLKQKVELLMAEVSTARNASTQIDPAALQLALSSMMGRPQMPVNPQGKAFDAQTAQINASSATAELVRQKKTRRKAG